MDMIDEEERPGRLMNLLSCRDRRSALLTRGERTMADECVVLRRALACNTTNKAVCDSVCTCVYYRASVSLSLSGSSVLSLSVRSRRRAPLPTHNPFLPRRFTLLLFAPTLRWSYHTTHTSLACPPRVCSCGCFLCDGVYFPQTSPIITCPPPSVQRFCSRTRLLAA